MNDRLDPTSRSFSSHPQRVTFFPASPIRNSPQLLVRDCVIVKLLYLCISGIGKTLLLELFILFHLLDKDRLPLASKVIGLLYYSGQPV